MRFTDDKRRTIALAPVYAAFILNAFFGAYPEATGIASDLLLGVSVFLVYLKKEPVGPRRPRLPFFGIAVLQLGYLVSVFYAVDRGMALLGMLRFLPLPLFGALLLGLSPEARKKLLTGVPLVGVVQLPFAFSAFGGEIFRSHFYTYGRFHGGFGYANSFALFLLCGVLILLTAELSLPRWTVLAGTALLCVGILLSGSRSVLLLAVPLLVPVIWKRREYRVPLLALFGALLIGATAYGLLSGDLKTVARFLNYSAAESTYYDRLLYLYDALPLVWKHPFGLGYKGYMFLIPRTQTGLYSVTYVHCDYLQLMLDIGILPALFFFFTAWKTVFSRAEAWRRLLLLAILLHCAIDFDLQFTNILFLICFATCGEAKEPEKKKARPAAFRRAALILSALAVCAGGVFGVPAAAEAFGSYALALRMNPCFTMSRLQVLRSAGTTEEAAQIATELLRHNRHVAVAYDALARSMAEQNRYREAIEEKNKAIACAPLYTDEYEDKFLLLYRAIHAADAAGDAAALADYCREMLSLPQELQAAKDKLSELGKKMQDQPRLTLSPEAAAYIEELERILETSPTS